jgi:hypothetical protein
MATVFVLAQDILVFRGPGLNLYLAVAFFDNRHGIFHEKLISTVYDLHAPYNYFLTPFLFLHHLDARGAHIPTASSSPPTAHSPRMAARASASMAFNDTL